MRSGSEYPLLTVLLHFRQFDHYRNCQAGRDWYPLPPIDKKQFPVGIMGLGQLGKASALRLKAEGFPVLGWKNSPAAVPQIQVFYGQDQLPEFLSRCRILICLLPLTPATRHILNLDLFTHLPQNAYLIKALDDGILSGACLDVFETDPLPPEHPFWNRPEIRITLHISSQTHPESVVPPDP